MALCRFRYQKCSFDRIVLNWIRRAVAGSIQISDNAKTWRDIISLSPSSSETDDIQLKNQEMGRFVHVLINKPETTDGYILSELEVYGTGGTVAMHILNRQ